MKKIAIVAALLATTACDGVNQDDLTNQATEMGSKARGAVEGWLAELQGQPDQAKTEEAKAETGEVAIGEATATPQSDAVDAPADAPAAPDAAVAEATVEQKIEEARQAVTTLIPAATYVWSRPDGTQARTLTVNADGSATEKSAAGRETQAQLRKVGDDVCFELTASNSIGNCFTVSEADADGVLTANGTNNSLKTKLTPAS